MTRDCSSEADTPRTSTPGANVGDPGVIACAARLPASHVFADPRGREAPTIWTSAAKASRIRSAWKRGQGHPPAPKISRYCSAGRRHAAAFTNGNDGRSGQSDSACRPCRCRFRPPAEARGVGEQRDLDVYPPAVIVEEARPGAGSEHDIARDLRGSTRRRDLRQGAAVSISSPFPASPPPTSTIASSTPSTNSPAKNARSRQSRSGNGCTGQPPPLNPHPSAGPAVPSGVPSRTCVRDRLRRQAAGHRSAAAARVEVAPRIFCDAPELRFAQRRALACRAPPTKYQRYLPTRRRGQPRLQLRCALTREGAVDP